mmetsp:Transcript_7364/g.13052  ORF Transcript_7364/g.13052 Transcript_7364/m.13052 type:complete len:616 (-) Transcript_7364:194-2041(-)
MATLKLVLLGLLPLATFASREQADDVVSGDWEPERAEAFVQHKRSHSRSGGGRSRTHCQGESLREHCPRAMGAYLDILKRPAGQLEKYKARLGRGDELLKELKDMDPKLYNDNEEARRAFDAIRHVDARKVLAFKETWTQEDSEMLKKIGQVRDGWTDGPFTQKKFVAQLPSISILEELLNAGPMAIVGAGPSLTKKGDDIDGHPTVVRFNNHIGTELNNRDTGMKMTVHVINGQVDFDNEPGVLHFDLESTFPGSSMCKRWHRTEHVEPPKSEVTILFRPSAVCGLPEAMASFTRGFLFYWLVGRLAEHSDNYGMGFRDGLTHRVKDESMVNERFLEFEHGLYKAADRILARKAAEEQSKAAALAAAQAEAQAKAEANATTTNAADAPTTAAPAGTEAEAPTTAAPEKEEAKATTVAAKEDKADGATTAAPKKEADAATTAAAPGTTGKADAATTAAAADAATTAAPVVTTAEAAATTAAAKADASPTTAAPEKEAEAAGTTVAAQPAESNATKAEGNTTKAEGKATKDESDATEPDEADSMKGDEGEEQAADEEEEEQEDEEQKEDEETPAEKPKGKMDKMHHKMKHMKSGATSTSAFALASLITVATWMLHM